MLTKTFEPKGRKYVHNEELRDLYSSNIIGIIKSGTIGWMGHMARRGKKGYECRALVEKRKERDHLEDLDAERRIILKHTLNKTDWLRVDRICLGLDRDVTGSCENGDEPLGSVKLQELLLHKKKRPFLLDLVSQPGMWPAEFFHSTI